MCQVQMSCKDGWKRDANNCYYFSTTSATWFDAKRKCLEQNSRLADATSISEIKFLQTNAEKYGKNFWLDGSDESEEGVWFWATSGQKFTVTDWHRRTSYEPNNEDDNEHCLNIHRDLDYQWNDAGCSNRFRYICEKPLM
ncbi:C-type lectin domain family 4 member K-like [Mytilus californianus]|uniref:C-type lectin domain family 4 member K-like n=1 Tax=Mytilus californianus TaxID=6549 RepID=UPI0022458477|nr:C-type lectin domain family 4 member K-like [Mytilus californianus]